MTREVTVFVVFDSEELPAVVDIRSAALYISREQPRWSIGAVGNQSFRLGRYDQLPVVVTLRHDPDVLEESQRIASHLDVAGSIRRRVALGSARFEFVWDLRQDNDVVPETAALIVACAQALARWSKGVVVITEGSSVIPDDVELTDGQAFTALFPN